MIMRRTRGAARTGREVQPGQLSILRWQAAGLAHSLAVRQQLSTKFTYTDEATRGLPVVARREKSRSLNVNISSAPAASAATR